MRKIKLPLIVLFAVFLAQAFRTAPNALVLNPRAIGIEMMEFDGNGYLWLITKTNLIRLQVQTGQYISYENSGFIDKNDWVVSTASMPDGSIIALTGMGAVGKLQQGIWSKLREGGIYAPGQGIHKQLDGTLQIELGYMGALRYDGKSIVEIKTPDKFECGFYSLLDGINGIWAIDGGCMKFVPILRRFQDGIWVKVEGYSPETLMRDAQGNVWFLDSNFGVIKGDLSEKIDMPPRSYGVYTADVAFAPDNSLWLSDYQDGLYHFVNGHWESIVNPDLFKMNSGFIIGQDNTIYLGAKGYGLLRFQKSRWSQFLLVQ